MNGIGDLLSSDAILLDVNSGAKKQLFQALAEKAAELTGQDEQQIFSTLLQRERLGTTGVGNGIAIPHGKIAGLEKITTVFARLTKPLDYDSVDDQPVDIVFLLLVPDDAGTDHLKALSRVARIMRDQQVVEQIKNCSTSDEVLDLLNREPARDAA